MLRHPHIVGTLELSTAYTWTAAEESLKVSTSKGVYRLSQMEELTFEPIPSTILGIPIEKVRQYNKTIEYLYVRNTPILLNNQIYSQGYFSELQTFIDAVESRQNHVLTDLQSVRSVYEVMAEIHDTTSPQSYTNSVK
jgi:virulence factor